MKKLLVLILVLFCSPAMAATIASYTNLTAPDGLEETVVSDETDSSNTKNIQYQVYVEDRALSKSVAGGSTVTLTNAESLYGQMALTGTITANIDVTVPDNREKFYQLYNNTAGAFTVTFKTVSGTGVVLPQGSIRNVYCDGTNCDWSPYETSAFAETLLDDAAASNVLTTLGITAYIQTLLDDADAATARATLPPFASGTKMPFFQASCPTGWTKDTTAALDGSAIRLETGTGGGTGGSDDIATLEHSHDDSLAAPAHTHSVPRDDWGSTSTPGTGRLTTSQAQYASSNNVTGAASATALTGSVGNTSGLAPKYANFIVCTKD